MRKIICFILCFALVFATAVPSIYAVEEKCDCKNSPIIYVRLTRVEPRYGLARRLFPSALHSFLKGAGLSANSCFTE